MRVNRGLPPPADGPRKSVLIVLVQTRDLDGFYVNLHEVHDVATGVKLAEQWTQENKVETRVCVGADRKVMRVIHA